MKQRLDYLDSFRGLTIFAMILSGSIAFNNCLPAWMYHAQVPPPLHKFNGNIAGITWVDLVFPFFLFAMGVSIPFSLNKKINQTSYLKIIIDLLYRYLLLACFSLIVQQVKIISGKQSDINTAFYFLFIFYLCMLIYIDWKKLFNWPLGRYWNIILAFFTIWFMVFVPKKFDFAIDNLKIESDIIIMVLANVGFSASLFWLLFKKNDWAFWLGYGVIFSLFCWGKLTKGNFSEWYNFSPFPVFFRWEFHKYLLIVLPGVFIGKCLLKKNKNTFNEININKQLLSAISIFIFIIVVLYGLFTRQLVLAWILSLIFFCLLYFLLDIKNNRNKIYNTFYLLSFILYFFGLTIEPTQGGIKKDSSTFSYLVLTPALAALVLLAFKQLHSACNAKNKILNFLNGVGSNSLGAYEMGKFLVWPLMIITATKPIFDQAVNNKFECFFRGFVYTFLACLFAFLFNKLKLNWKA